MDENEKEKILAILGIERELARRAKEPLRGYNREKVHLKQMEFHRSDKRNRWVFGGNRSGKTECGAAECVWMALGEHPYKPNRPDAQGWVVSLTQQVQRDVAQAKVLKYLPPRRIEDIVMASGRKGAPEYGVIDHIVVRNAFGGFSKIGFKSCDQGREKFQGASLDFVWFDEEPPADVYEECRMRVFDRGGYIFGTMTPLKGLTWVYGEIELNERGDPEVWCTHMEWKDNPYLGAAEVEGMTALMSEEEQQSRRFGRFHTGQGLVYPEFDPERHVIDPFDVPADWQCEVSIDPGLRNPTSCHFYAVDHDGRIYVVAEHYERGRDIDWHAERILAIADALGWRRDSSGRLRALIDSAASQRTLASEKSVAELFLERGISVNTRVNKDLYSGIQRIKSLFCKDPPEIFIFKSCVNLIRELKGYWWGEGDRPRKIDDHALDELRYFVMSRPAPAPLPVAEKSVIQRDKETLVRAARRERSWMTRF